MPTSDPGKLIEIGRRLAPLRDEGVLIIGSGFMTHGLPFIRDWRFEAAAPGWSKEFDIWAGVAVHKNTPDAVISTINKAFYAALDNPEIRKAFEATGNVVLKTRTPAELSKIYNSEIERYRTIARNINLQPQ